MTNSFSSVSSELHSLLSPIFSKINNENWNQFNGIVCLEERKYKCCIGAHIAKELDIRYENSLNYFFYSDSITYLKNRFKLSTFQLNAIFHCGGSPEHPFGKKKWNHHPLFVLNNIRFIETYPPKRNNFECYYHQNDVKKWLEIERKRIELCKEREKLLCKV